MTRSLNVICQRQQNSAFSLTARSDKSVAYVTNNKRLLDVLYCWSNWQTRSIAWPLCDSIATCFFLLIGEWYTFCLTGIWSKAFGERCLCQQTEQSYRRVSFACRLLDPGYRKWYRRKRSSLVVQCKCVWSNLASVTFCDVEVVVRMIAMLFLALDVDWCLRINLLSDISRCSIFFDIIRTIMRTIDR